MLLEPFPHPPSFAQLLVYWWRNPVREVSTLGHGDQVHVTGIPVCFKAPEVTGCRVKKQASIVSRDLVATTLGSGMGAGGARKEKEADIRRRHLHCIFGPHECLPCQAPKIDDLEAATLHISARSVLEAIQAANNGKAGRLSLTELRKKFPHSSAS